MSDANERVHTALHVLWTKYTHQPLYVKAEWLELDNAINAAQDSQCTSPCVDNYCPVHGIVASAKAVVDACNKES